RERASPSARQVQVFATDDTIVAISTPPGRGGIGVVRLSGPSAEQIATALLNRASSLEPRHATFGHAHDAEGNRIDQVVATWFSGPNSYTGQDVGKIDLPQAEAVADLVEAVTPLQARAAMDQLEGTLTAAIGRVDAGLFDLSARLEASLDFPEEGFHF